MVGATPSESVASDTHNSSPETIDPSLHSADGQVEVVVRLSGVDQIQIEQSDKPIDTLQTQADRDHEPVIDYAKRTRGVTVENRFWVTNAVLLEVDTNTVDLEEIQSITGVERLHENFKVEVAATQSATPTNRTTTMSTATVGSKTTGTYTYGLEQINATGTWNQFGTKGADVRVAVLDTGVDAANHSDLTPTAGGWKDFVYDKPEPYDDDGHGSHVSGTIVGGQAPDGMYYGVAPEAELLHGKVFDRNGDATFTDLMDGFQWSMNNDADVISLSLGTDGYNDFLIDSVETATAADIIVVASVGNSGENTSSSPGNYYNTVNIGATTESQQVASISGGEEITTADAWGDSAPESWPETYIVPTVSAPGNKILSTYSEGQYAKVSGTSMAAPHVSGAIALMQSATDEQLTPAQLETALVDSAWKPEGSSLEQDTRYGYGIIDTYHATASVADSDSQADLTLDSATIDSDSVTVGESVMTELEISNSGDRTGTYVASLEINGTTTQTKSVDVAPGETERLSFSSKFDTPGNYEIAIDGINIGVLTVSSPAEFEITKTEMNTSSILTEESVLINATVENIGESSGSFTASLRVFDNTKETQSVTIQPDQQEKITFESSFSESGVYTISINDSFVGDLYVDQPATTMVTPSKPSTGDSVFITTTIESPKSNIEGIWGGDHQFDSIELNETTSPGTSTEWNQFLLDSPQSSLTITWKVIVPDTAAGESVSINSTVLMNERENRYLSHSVRVNDTSAVSYYSSSSSNEIGDTEIARAVQDWANSDGWFKESTDPATEIAKLVQKWANT